MLLLFMILVLKPSVTFNKRVRARSEQRAYARRMFDQTLLVQKIIP